jgi:hypothetical protein
MLNTFCICVYREDLATLTQKMHEVSAVSAARVEDTHPPADISSQDLVEYIYINLSELLLHVHGDFSRFHCFSSRLILGCLGATLHEAD